MFLLSCAQLEQAQAAQNSQRDALQKLASRPNHLLFYRALLILIESVFVSCKALAGGFVALGGDAAASHEARGAATALRVCGALLSLAPCGSLLQAGASLAAATVAGRDDARRTAIATHIAGLLTMSEASQAASDIALL